MPKDTVGAPVDVDIVDGALVSVPKAADALLIALKEVEEEELYVALEEEHEEKSVDAVGLPGDGKVETVPICLLLLEDPLCAGLRDADGEAAAEREEEAEGDSLREEKGDLLIEMLGVARADENELPEGRRERVALELSAGAAVLVESPVAPLDTEALGVALGIAEPENAPDAVG